MSGPHDEPELDEAEEFRRAELADEAAEERARAEAFGPEPPAERELPEGEPELVDLDDEPEPDDDEQ